MSTILSVLNGPSPAELRAQRAQPAAATATPAQRIGPPLDGLGELVYRLGAIESPIGQEFARGYILEEYNVRIPTVEEYELGKIQTADKIQKLHDEQRGRMVATLVGFLADNKNEDAGEAFSVLAARFGVLPPAGLPIEAGQSLGDVMADLGLPGELDVSLLERPEELQQASGALAQALGMPELQLSTEDLLLSQLTGQAARLTPEARAAEETQEEARTLRAAEEVAKTSQQFAEDEDSPLRAGYEQSFDRAEESHEQAFGAGVDLDPAGFDDLEEMGGAQAYAAGLTDAMRSASAVGVRPETFVRLALSEPRGQRIGEILRDRLQVDEEGTAAPKDDVGALYLQVLSDLSSRAGINVSRALETVGLGDAGIQRIAPRGLRASLEAGGG